MKSVMYILFAAKSAWMRKAKRYAAKNIQISTTQNMHLPKTPMKFNMRPELDKYTSKTEKHLVRIVKERLASRLGLKYTHFLKYEDGTDHIPPVAQLIQEIKYTFSQPNSKNFLVEF